MGSGGRDLREYIFDIQNGCSRGKLSHRLRMLLGFEKKRSALKTQPILSHFDSRSTFLHLSDLNAPEHTLQNRNDKRYITKLANFP